MKWNLCGCFSWISYDCEWFTHSSSRLDSKACLPNSANSAKLHMTVFLSSPSATILCRPQKKSLLETMFQPLNCFMCCSSLCHNMKLPTLECSTYNSSAQQPPTAYKVATCFSSHISCFLTSHSLYSRKVDTFFF